MKNVTLEQMVGGGLHEQFDKSFDRVIENLADPNTSFREARKITIELKFTQNESRDDVSCAISVKEKLAAQAPMQTSFAVGKNLKTGEMFAKEYGKHNQPTFYDLVVDAETGEVLEEQPKTSNVVDLRIPASN